MKKLLSISLLLFSVIFISCATTKPITNATFERVIIAEGKSSDILYEETLQWMAQTFVSSKAVLEYQNKEHGEIIGNGASYVPYMWLSARTGFLIKIQVKDNKVRVQISHAIKNPDTSSSQIINTQGDWDDFCRSMDTLLNSYAEFLNKSSESNDW